MTHLVKCTALYLPAPLLPKTSVTSAQYSFKYVGETALQIHSKCYDEEFSVISLVLVPPSVYAHLMLHQSLLNYFRSQWPD